jgi:anhydro-N-acetylmuramic acid kinase
MGERLLFAQYPMLLNLGGIANISIHQNENVLAFDIAAANQVFNHFANLMGFPFDDGGKLAASGQVHEPLLQALDRLEFYSKAAPKSLANSFSKQTVIPLMETFQLSAVDQLATYIEHLSKIISSTVQTYADADLTQQPLLVTGGGALNTFLINKLKQTLETSAIQLVVPDDNTVLFKEALIMGLLGILRWREEVTALKTVTGAERNTIGGALWLGA